MRAMVGGATQKYLSVVFVVVAIEFDGFQGIRKNWLA
jgi:hypothetical protein